MEQLTHWKKLTNPNYIGAYDFDKGEERTLVIESVKLEEVVGIEGKKEYCTVIRWVDKKQKPFICNRTNAKMISALYKTPFIEEWSGKSITLLVESVRSFGDVVDALRIKRHVPVNPAQPKVKPTLQIGSPAFDLVVNFMNGKDASFDEVRKRYTITPEVIDAISNKIKPTE